MKIYLDFDGTVVTHQYPEIGDLNAGCLEVISKLQVAGHDIILNSYRANKKGKKLISALSYLNDNITSGAKPINQFLEKKVDPGAWSMEEAKKLRFLFIDDYCFGIPLKDDETKHPVVDWVALDKVLAEHSFYETVAANDVPATGGYFPVTMTLDDVNGGVEGSKNLFSRMFKNIPASMNIKMNMNTL